VSPELESDSGGMFGKHQSLNLTRFAISVLLNCSLVVAMRAAYLDRSVFALLGFGQTAPLLIKWDERPVLFLLPLRISEFKSSGTYARASIFR
jgi:hypothetical protein